MLTQARYPFCLRTAANEKICEILKHQTVALKESLLAQLQAQRDTLEAKEAQADELKLVSQSKSEKIVALEAKRNVFHQRLAAAEAAKKAAETKADEAAAKLPAMEAAATKLQNKLAAAEQLQHTSEGERKMNEDVVAMLKQKSDVATSAVAGLQVQRNEATTAVSQLTEEIRVLHNDISNSDAELAAIKKSNEDICGQLAANESEISRLRDKLERVTRTLRGSSLMPA